MMSQSVARPRLTYLDTTKGFAIFSVLVLHLASDDFLLGILGPWHVWQAMPLFLFVAGVTGSMSWKKYKGNFPAYYRDLPAKAKALFMPYAVGTILFHMVTQQKLDIALFFNTMVMGYLGPGGYFVPLIVMHLIAFPLILHFRERLGSDLRFLAFALVLSIFFEALFAFGDVDATSYVYRIFYFRYLFVCCLGAVLADANPFNPRLFGMLTGASALYIFLVCYLGWQMPGIRTDGWYFQHYPGFFYTAAIVLTLRRLEDRIPFLPVWVRLGKSSYDIFIFQLFFFVTIAPWFEENFFRKCLALVFCACGGLCLTWLQERWRAMKNTPK